MAIPFLVSCGGAQSAEPVAPPVSEPAPVASAPEAAPPETAAAAAAPESTSAVATSVPTPAPAPAPAAPPSVIAQPFVAPVIVHNIGLHIGGGPNDAATKAPFLKALAGAFDAFAACGNHPPAGQRAGTFGIDLLVGRDGGQAQTSNPRTAIPGDAFRTCVVTAFEAVTFEKPKNGPTKLSYALKFEPK